MGPMTLTELLAFAHCSRGRSSPLETESLRGREVCQCASASTVTALVLGRRPRVLRGGGGGQPLSPAFALPLLFSAGIGRLVVGADRPPYAFPSGGRVLGELRSVVADLVPVGLVGDLEMKAWLKVEFVH